MYLYEFGNGIRLVIWFLPPLKLNLSVYFGPYVVSAYGLFFGGHSPFLNATILNGV